MARAKQDKTYNTFIKGLVTEATGLTYPEGSARDLNNVDLGTDGSVRRRPGISQERDGRVIGGGYLSDTLYTNNTGGPLSLAPSVLADNFSDTWAGDVSNSGEWTLGGDDATNDGSKWLLRATQPDRMSWMRRDLNIPSWDEITFTFTAEEPSNNESKLACLIGADSAGAGQGFEVSGSGIRTITTEGHQTGYVRGAILYDYDAEAKPYTYKVQLTKQDTNTYIGSVQVRDGTVVKRTIPLIIGTIGENIELLASSTQKHTGRWEVDDLSARLRLFGVETDLPDETVEDERFAISTHSWVAPNGDGTKAFQVFQVGNTLFFRDAKQETVSKVFDSAIERRTATLQFDGFGTGLLYKASSSQAAQVKLQSATGFGRIWFTSRAVVPFYAELDEDGTGITLKPCGLRDGSTGVQAVVGQRMIRDLIGLDDGLETTETPSDLSDTHLYNLLNQGWPSAKINDYFSSQSAYPANNHQWFLGKQSDDSFDPTLLIEQDFGTQFAPKGRILLDALLGERDGQAHAVAGVTSPIDFEGERDVTASTGWEAVAFYAGRVWLAGEVNPRRPGCVYYSKTLEGTDDSGKFHQIADPSSEHFNDLVATDGGYIPIPEAGSIRRLVPFGTGLLVMADTGIWFVYGKDGGGFTANSFSIPKITSTGTISPDTVVRTDQAVFYWAENSIHVIRFSEDNGLPLVEDLAEASIFKYYQLIPRASREVATSCYDPISKKAFWFWLSDGDRAETFKSLYDRALIFDARTGAFSTYSFAASYEEPLFGVACAFPRRTPTLANIFEDVYDNDLAAVTRADGAVVYAETPMVDLTTDDLSTSIKLVLVTSVDAGLRIGEFTNMSFVDFDDIQGVESSEQQAYITTGDETLGDLQRNKQAVYLHSFFRRTETGFYPNLQPKRPSACNVYARWDWTNAASANRWSAAQRAYRLRKPYTPVNSEDTFDTGEEIIYTKLKMRGKGRALSVRYESESGKDFRLLGFSAKYGINGE